MSASLDEIALRAKMPQLLGRQDVALLVAKLTGQPAPSVHTVRRWPIPYRQLGRNAVYEAGDVVSFCRGRLAEAPVRRAPPPRGKT